MESGPIFPRRRSSFLRDLILGMVFLIMIFLPWKLLELTKLTAVFAAVGDQLGKMGFPGIIGHLVTVAISLGLLALLGLVVRRVIRSRLTKFPFLAGLLDTGDHIANLFARDVRNRIVLVSWPTEDVRSLAVVTAETTDEVTGERFAVIFIPNSPSPRSGLMRVVRAEQLTETNLRPSHLLSMAMSRGVVTPERVRLTPPPPAPEEPQD